MIPLSKTRQNQSYHIHSLKVERQAERLHLNAMGLCESAEIKRIQRTPFGDPVEYLVDGEHLIAIEEALADQIFVEENEKQTITEDMR